MATDPSHDPRRNPTPTEGNDMTATKTPARKLDAPAPDAEGTTETPARDDAPLTTREVAEALGTDPRTLRKYLRSDESITNAGKGGRYRFTRGDVKSMRPRFDRWVEAHTRAKDDAPSDDDLRAMLADRTVKQLREDLDAHGIHYDRSRPVKADLIKALVENRDIWF